MAVLICSVAASADVIRLRNGSTIRGTISRETQSGILVRVGRNQEIHISYEEIVEILRDGESVPVGEPGQTRKGIHRDRKREEELIRQYSRKMELVYRRFHPGVMRIPYQVRKEECDPVRSAKRYGLPVAEAESNKVLENMFELTLACYKSGSSTPWRRTLLFYGRPRHAYIQAVSQDIDLANIYLEYPNMPYLLNLADK